GAREPKREELRCYFARAKRGRGSVEQAWQLAEDLWLSGRSVDDACDPLFKLWRQAGGLNDELIWERALLAYGARQGSLLRYISSLGSKEIQTSLAKLRNSYARPDRTLSIAKSIYDLTSSKGGSDSDAGNDRHRATQLLVVGLERLSRYQPAKALSEFQSLPADLLDTAQQQRLTRAVAFRGLLERDGAVRPWLDKNLASWRDDQLTEMRLRWALLESDFPTVSSTIGYLSPEKQKEGIWLYWHARSMEELGMAEPALQQFSAAASERSYYGFLSADKTGMPYSFNDAAPLEIDQPVFVSEHGLQASLARIDELLALDENRLAHSEWVFLLQRENQAVQRGLASIAEQQGWFRFAIDAANRSRLRDVLAFRFPLAFEPEFLRGAAAENLPLSEVMAISRRESAFFPSARSSAGARGLMQLMPATGRAVARSKGTRIRTSELYDIDRNIALGTAYYRQLLDDFSGSRPVALAAYNAGPNRVKNWLGKNLPLDQWIETIPFRETRDYVKAVLAYAVIFDHRLGQDAQLLTSNEQAARH
ncbi:MAG: transglycosylase SLT domain-containing protein, partial [Pseudomonadota bacterium]